MCTTVTHLIFGNTSRIQHKADGTPQQICLEIIKLPTYLLCFCSAPTTIELSMALIIRSYIKDIWY